VTGEYEALPVIHFLNDIRAVLAADVDSPTGAVASG
jgi:hypothetical protein